MPKIIKWSGMGLFFVVLFFAFFSYTRYGGGKEYPDISTEPRYDPTQLEVFFEYDEPLGNIAVTKDTSQPGRVFFTVHPESRPEKHKLLEITDGKAIPYPNAKDQHTLFNTVLGIFIDQQNRLWTLDHGNHGLEEVQLTAFDLHSDSIVHRYIFPDSVAETFSMFNDLSLTPDGRYAFISDVSFIRKNPSVIVYDSRLLKSRRILEGHPSVYHEGYVPVTPYKKMSFLGGLIDLQIGIDGIDVSKDGQYVYYAPMSGSVLYRIPVKICTDFSLSEKEMMAYIEKVAIKPLSDGIRTDYNGHIYITDIENYGIYLLEESGEAYTLIKDPRIRWADGLALGNDGYFYLSDSDLPNQMLQNKKHMKKHAPYTIYRFKPLPN